MKLILENWRKFLMNEKLMLKPGPNGWDKYCELVAEAYAAAPAFEDAAVPHFEAMKPFVDKMFKRIEGVIDVHFVEEHPYANADELRQDVEQNKILKILLICLIFSSIFIGNSAYEAGNLSGTLIGTNGILNLLSLNVSNFIQLMILCIVISILIFINNFKILSRKYIY